MWLRVCTWYGFSFGDLLIAMSAAPGSPAGPRPTVGSIVLSKDHERSGSIVPPAPHSAAAQAVAVRLPRLLLVGAASSHDASMLCLGMCRTMDGYVVGKSRPPRRARPY